MPQLPPDPVSPREFLEDVVPALFAEAELGEQEQALDLKIGICLEGDDGGAWTLHFVEGELGITRGRQDDCALTLLQSVTDWRAALWEGRPALVADLARIVLTQGPGALSAPGTPSPAIAARNPMALQGLSELHGLIEGIVATEAAPDWRLGVMLGPGPIPATPQAVIRIGAEQAEAIRRGDLHPIEALIGGQLRLEGDLGLILQLQAIAMNASLPPAPESGQPI